VPEKEASSHRLLLIVAGAVVITTLALLPASGRELGTATSFLPAMLSVVVCFDLLSVYLLVGDFRDRGDRRLLMMAAAYTWSLAVMVGYGLAFPGAITANPPLALTPSMAPYLYVAWHTGFPLLLGAAWAPWPARWGSRADTRGRRRTSVAVIAGAAVMGASVVAVIVLNAYRLPVLIDGLDTLRMTKMAAPVSIPLVLASLVAAAFGTARRTGPERWSSIAILVCLCDLTLTFVSAHRYSFGWYCGRSLTLVSSAVVLLAMLATFRRIKAQAEHDAVVDPLTGLSNRRGAYAVLDDSFARARRTGRPLAVVSLDLDLFKHVNDRYGHDVGDDVLTETGRLLTGGCRRSDFVARVGGEEFLIVVPDTDDVGARVVAEGARLLIRGMSVPGVAHTITASFGISVLHDDDAGIGALLRRVDRALYQAKHNGRDRVVVSLARTEHDLVDVDLGGYSA